MWVVARLFPSGMKMLYKGIKAQSKEEFLRLEEVVCFVWDTNDILWIERPSLRSRTVQPREEVFLLHETLPHDSKSPGKQFGAMFWRILKRQYRSHVPIQMRQARRVDQTTRASFSKHAICLKGYIQASKASMATWSWYIKQDQQIEYIMILWSHHFPDSLRVHNFRHIQIAREVKWATLLPALLVDLTVLRWSAYCPGLQAKPMRPSSRLNSQDSLIWWPWIGWSNGAKPSIILCLYKQLCEIGSSKTFYMSSYLV